MTNFDSGARIASIRFAEARGIRSSRIHRIGEYLPGQVIYNLGEYPARFSIRPTEYDHDLIRSLAERGVGLIQLHEEWNDSQRLLGADKYTSHDPEGLREFIRLCHSYGIKVLPYISSGFFDWRDPDFSERFSQHGVYELNSSYFRYRCCDAASPEWNDYLMPRLESILDTYEFDGLYNDMGYGCAGAPEYGYLDYDPYLEDLLARIYEMVKKRGGIVKIHQGQCVCPKTNTQVYDYLWVGECVRRASDLTKTAQFDPYVIVSPDYRFMEEKNVDALFAMTLPMMQFMIRTDGRPVTGERAFVPGVSYINNPDNNEQIHYEAMRAWYEAHPNGPYCYSEWSAIPEDVTAREKWFDYLALYRPMVKEGTTAYLDIKESRLTRAPLPEGILMSLFVNEECYLCISNVGKTGGTVELCDEWIDRRSGARVSSVTLSPNEIGFLKLVRK